MRILLTGGPGFVGSHTTSALIRAGHEVRLLVRSPEKIERVFKPHGVRPSDYVQGDITDADSVVKAIRGCDAVVHAAAVVATDPASEARIRETNFVGAKNVLDAAIAAGCDPIINISSSSALFPFTTDPVTPEHPVGTFDTAYGQTKAQVERYARELQAADHPVTILYPAGVLGPHDPNMGELMGGVKVWASQALPVGGMTGGYVDVRDIAKAVVLAMELGKGPRRYLLWGHYVDHETLAEHIVEATGRTDLKTPKVPKALMTVWGKAGDLARKYGKDLVVTSEACDYLYNFKPADQSATTDELGLAFRPLVDTLGDTLLWLHEVGELPAKAVGKLAIT